MSKKKLEIMLGGLIFLGGGLLFLVLMIFSQPLLGLSITIAIISLILLLYSGSSRDRRFRSGYKNNIEPIPFRIRFRNAGIGFIISIVLYLIHSYNSETDKSQIIKAIVEPKNGLHLRTDSLIHTNNIILTIPQGDTVNFLFSDVETNSSWIKVKYKEQEGWVSKTYLDQFK